MSFAFVERSGVELLMPDCFPGLIAAFTTRHGGISRGDYAELNLGLHVGDDPDTVIENRRRACAAVGVNADDLVVAVQSHGPNVAVVDGSFRGRGAVSVADAVADADALVTATPGVPLMLMVADCVPIICWEPERQVVAVIHAGWRGTISRVTQAAVRAMVALGCEPAKIIAAIGPAISPNRYQVGEEVVDQAHVGLGAELANRVTSPDGTGRFLFDLWTANHAVLTQAGVSATKITTARVDSGSDKFFSDRLARPCGRFAAIVEIPAN